MGVCAGDVESALGVCLAVDGGRSLQCCCSQTVLDALDELRVYSAVALDYSQAAGVGNRRFNVSTRHICFVVSARYG